MDLLSFGIMYPLITNTIYALPVAKANLFTDASTPTIQQSNTPVFTANAAVTLTAGQAVLNGKFLRVTSAGPTNIVLARD